MKKHRKKHTTPTASSPTSLARISFFKLVVADEQNNLALVHIVSCDNFLWMGIFCVGFYQSNPLKDPLPFCAPVLCSYSFYSIFDGSLAGTIIGGF